MTTLDKDGPKKFIKYACEITTLPPQDYFKPIMAKVLTPHKIISFQDFILCVAKYTKSRWKDPLNLEAEIDPAQVSSFHRVIFTGIRDPELRKRKSPKYLAGSQEGFWHFVLEEALEYGLPPEKVALFRSVFHLTKQYGYSDDSFFNRTKDS